MKISGIIYFLIFIAVFIALITVPYIEFLQPEQKFKQYDQIIDFYKKGNILTYFIFSACLFPFLFIAQSTYWKSQKNWHKYVLISQGLLILTGGYFIWIIMSLNMFTGPYNYLVNYYIILIYVGLGSGFSISLGVKYFNSKSLLYKMFKKLSLTPK